ncbi:PP2C family serine/threonine-protein phosphatase [Pontibacter sp. BAB1700]|uniref:PP2C family protein-serine/threonine phosphatase n=1 Tax=Pontibacter sp. BAB1700 TaxID=1144253 RepID=UPI00026BDDAE|nr:PP2C family serine/threonine-protein phosphatase [Pontibacter sp. BAB1700]EJF09512.1 Ser/Thr phosphatase [Pontibacter sp. BAB1700]
MHAYTLSRKGKRETNQDYIISKTIGPDLSLHLIADGMGGYEDGDLAARTVAESISESLSYTSQLNFYEIIQQAISFANSSISKYTEDGGKKLGATIGGIVIGDRKALCFWVGDVKIFHFRDGDMLFESTPHSLMHEILKNGSITDAAKASKYRHVVTRSVQGDHSKSEAEFHIIEEILDTDILLICSDGVHDTLAGIQLQHFIRNSLSPTELLSKIDERCSIDSKDNYSAVIVKN